MKPAANYHIGETKVNTQGRLMKIVGYRKRIDIDVEFEDGVIRNSVRYENFEQGKILHPNDMPKRKFIGEKHSNSQGEKAKIINIIDSHTVDIQFEDGTIRKALNYQHFKNGRFKHPNKHDKYCQSMIGKKFKNTSGLTFKIKDFKNKNNITVQFEDGTIKENVKFANLKKGVVQHPNTPASSHEMYLLYLLKDYGFKKYPLQYFADLGLGRYEIDLYNENLKVGIEYDGIRFHKSKEKVQIDSDKNLRCSELGINLIRIRPDELPKLNNSLSKVFDYHIENPNNYQSFFAILKDVFVYLNNEYNLNISTNTCIDPEDYYQWRSQNYCLNTYKHFGEEAINSKGLKMKIVDYINFNNLTVEFPDGSKRFGVQYPSFINGETQHPKELVT